MAKRARMRHAMLVYVERKAQERENGKRDHYTRQNHRKSRAWASYHFVQRV